MSDQTKGPINIVCGACGSADVMRDAWAEWSEENQSWELGAVFDAGFCGDCDGEATLKEVPITLQDAEPAANTSVEAMSPTKEELLRIVAMFARMNYDCEILADGDEFDMVSDDAVETLSSAIVACREILHPYDGYETTEC